MIENHVIKLEEIIKEVADVSTWSPVDGHPHRRRGYQEGDRRYRLIKEKKIKEITRDK